MPSSPPLFCPADHVLLAGGTGFVGLNLLAWLAARPRAERPKLTVLCRRPGKLREANPGLVDQLDIQFFAADICADTLPEGEFHYVIHGANSSGPDVAADPARAMGLIAGGTGRILDLAVRARVRGFLLLSSGAVYGPLPDALERYPEDFTGAPDCLKVGNAYGSAKRYAEQLACCMADQHGLPVKIARCFSFVGPYLRLGGQLAIGNFIRDALWNDAITVQGDGSAIRAYQAGEDMAAWLLNILVRGSPCRPYHVGSESGMSLVDLAHLVAGTLAPGKPVRVLGAPNASPRSRYVPDTFRARHELGMISEISLTDAIQGAARWALNPEVRK